MSVVFVYITAATETEAQTIARAIVEDRLAACANILPGMRSVYHWQGKMEEAAETVVIFKTRAALFDALERRVRELHSYEIPCVIALPLAAASQPYLDWILTETMP